MSMQSNNRGQRKKSKGGKRPGTSHGELGGGGQRIEKPKSTHVMIDCGQMHIYADAIYNIQMQTYSQSPQGKDRFVCSPKGGNSGNGNGNGKGNISCNPMGNLAQQQPPLTANPHPPHHKFKKQNPPLPLMHFPLTSANFYPKNHPSKFVVPDSQQLNALLSESPYNNNPSPATLQVKPTIKVGGLSPRRGATGGITVGGNVMNLMADEMHNPNNGGNIRNIQINPPNPINPPPRTQSTQGRYPPTHQKQKLIQGRLRQIYTSNSKSRSSMEMKTKGLGNLIALAKKMRPIGRIGKTPQTAVPHPSSSCGMSRPIDCKWKSPSSLSPPYNNLPLRNITEVNFWKPCHDQRPQSRYNKETLCTGLDANGGRTYGRHNQNNYDNPNNEYVVPIRQMHANPHSKNTRGNSTNTPHQHLVLPGCWGENPLMPAKQKIPATTMYDSFGIGRDTNKYSPENEELGRPSKHKDHKFATQYNYFPRK